MRNSSVQQQLHVQVDPFYSEENQARLHRNLAELNAKEGVQHDLIEADDTLEPE